MIFQPPSGWRRKKIHPGLRGFCIPFGAAGNGQGPNQPNHRHVAEDEDLLDVGRIAVAARRIAEHALQPVADHVESLLGRRADVGHHVLLEQIANDFGAARVEIVGPLRERNPDGGLIGCVVGLCRACSSEH